MKLEVISEAGDEQLDELGPLFDAAREHDHHEPLDEHKWLDLVHGGRRHFCGFIARDEGGDRPVGYAHLLRHPGQPAQWALELVVHPDHRGVGVEVSLTKRALEAIDDEGGGHVHLWFSQPSQVHEDLARELGLTKGRDLLHMRVGLPVAERAELPAGITLRSFEVGRDEDAWLEVNNRAFHHHPEQGAWDLETLERRMQAPWFDPRDLLVATDDAGMAGFNWVKIEPGGTRGEIHVIAIEPSRQGAGLGRALTLVGLEHMVTRGMQEGCLYVDADNASAVGLYETIGFRVHHTDRAYVTDV